MRWPWIANMESANDPEWAIAAVHVALRNPLSDDAPFVHPLASLYPLQYNTNAFQNSFPCKEHVCGVAPRNTARRILVSVQALYIECLEALPAVEQPTGQSNMHPHKWNDMLEDAQTGDASTKISPSTRRKKPKMGKLALTKPVVWSLETSNAGCKTASIACRQRGEIGHQQPVDVVHPHDRNLPSDSNLEESLGLQTSHSSTSMVIAASNIQVSTFSEFRAPA